MDYRKIVIEDVPELAKIYAETFNSAPWYDKWTQKTAEKRLSRMIENGGFFGIVSNKDCVLDVFYGVDYHSHLGTRRAGLAAVSSEKGFQRDI
ncbi:MAG: hypothetical protein IKJ82_04215, partial [Oscillospiraceae bacterium]|nr:hypothetical protein [Oscillospiraceae bacterium]